MTEAQTPSGIWVSSTEADSKARQGLDLMEAKLQELAQELSASNSGTEILQEQIAELELALEDVGWLRMTAFGDRDFSVAGLQRIRRLARMSFLKNPLIHHAVEVKADYVWGQSVSISARSEEINDVIQKFLDDPKNTSSFTGHQARLEQDRELTVEGDIFVAMFTNGKTGRIIIRTIFPDEIKDIITNPDDSMEPWYYRREWSQPVFDPDKGGIINAASRRAFYPDWRLRYSTEVDRVDKIGESPVIWDAPIYHIKVGGIGGMKFGVPEIYSALDWARAVKENLEDHASILRALAQFAFNLKVKGGKDAVKAGRKRLESTLSADGAGMMETNPPSVRGSTFIAADGAAVLEPIKTAGATTHPDESQRLWLMTAAGTSIPETILSGNADAGSWATAKTLDRPTELHMANRQQLWADVYRDILGYVIDCSATAPQGFLQGEFTIDPYTQEKVVTLAPTTDEVTGVETPVDRDIDVDFPAILHRDMKETVSAIVQAATLDGKASAATIDDRTLSKLLLKSLGEDDIDEILDDMFDPEDITTDAGTPQANPNHDPIMDRPLPGMGDSNLVAQGIDPGGMMPPELAIVASARSMEATMRPLLERLGLSAEKVGVSVIKMGPNGNKRITRRRKPR